MPGRFWCNSRLPIIRTGASEDLSAMKDVPPGVAAVASARPEPHRRTTTSGQILETDEQTTNPCCHIEPGVGPRQTHHEQRPNIRLCASTFGPKSRLSR